MNNNLLITFMNIVVSSAVENTSFTLYIRNFKEVTQSVTCFKITSDRFKKYS